LKSKREKAIHISRRRGIEDGETYLCSAMGEKEGKRNPHRVKKLEL